MPAWMLLASLFLWSCSNEPSVQKYKVTKPATTQNVSAMTVSSGDAVDTGLPFTWVLPAGWEEGKQSSMRLASYNVPLGDEIGDFSLVQLGGVAGGVMANINRWRGQIGLSDATPQEIAGSSHMHSTQQGGEYLHVTLINDENPDNAIIAGIFERPGFTLFAKLTASKGGVEEAQSSFEAFCNSVVFKDA